MRRYPHERDQLWDDLNPWIASGAIQPTVSNYYKGLESVPQALKDIAERKVMGKAVVVVAPEGNGAKSRL